VAKLVRVFKDIGTSATWIRFA